MTEQSQPISTDRFPYFQRVLTFLTNCGLHSYGLKFLWFDHKRHLYYPFTHPCNQSHGGWFEASDEAILQQQERASIDTTILVANVFADAMAYRLELDHGYYRLRYSLVSTERQRLICDLLAEKGITQYELIEEISEGRWLPPYQNFVEIEDCSGTVATLTAVYGFWLGWANGRHTLGEECSCWDEYTLDDIKPQGKFSGFEQEVEGAWRRLHLRRHVEAPKANETNEMWELCEEDANQ